jgi:hypothetical protein
MEKKIITSEPIDKIIRDINNNENIKDDDINALSNNKVGVDIDPNVKSNNVNLQMCSCSIVFNCFSPNKPDIA